MESKLEAKQNSKFAEVLTAKDARLEALELKMTQLESKNEALELKVQQQESLLIALQQNGKFPNSNNFVPSNLAFPDVKEQNLALGKSIFPRTCREVRAADPSLSSGMHWIDPDGQGVGDDPIYVYCDMTKGLALFNDFLIINMLPVSS